MAKATTGTLAILLGIGLYNKGIITGPEDEDPDKAAFQKQQGWLPYAVKFGDNYYTYDWAQPGSMGLVLGSTIMSQLDKDGSIEAKDLASIIKTAYQLLATRCCSRAHCKTCWMYFPAMVPRQKT